MSFNDAHAATDETFVEKADPLLNEALFLLCLRSWCLLLLGSLRFVVTVALLVSNVLPILNYFPVVLILKLG
jgi:hypothetical protein